MKYLLDTQIILWGALDPRKLSPTVKEVISDSLSEISVSIVSAWEFEIKRNLNKMDLDGGLDGFFGILKRNSFALLGVEKTHIRQLSQLPFHHKDPFDRLLIATAMAENMSIITADGDIQKYDVPWVW